MGNPLEAWAAKKDEKRILLLRHGEIETPAKEKYFIGQIDLPLSPRGRAQAAYWHRHLAGIAFSQVVCSDLSRCLETARIVAADRQVPVLPDPAWREINLGAWDGLAFGDVKARWPDLFQQRGQAIDGFRPPGGESFVDLESRIAQAFDTLTARLDGDLLVVAHAGVNRVLLCHLLGMPVPHLFRLDQDYAALNLITWQAAGCRLHALNLTPNVT